ncbi:HPr family phosphocarrier protein [Salinispirillum sp. LH 10-3-1]|uniref:HPr family phosphocarrier protein n=1 Tax=Salinispirillum sp. LH 10-3-1 TaxID=2952525 RepID=A0AB38YIP4_9GAMM
MVNAGYMAEPYINSMRGREAVANTLLGNGIAIPHGLQEDRDYIHRTGIAVLQLPEGVVWKGGEKAHLIVGIAARSDEHIQVLSNLTDVLANPALADELAHTPDAERIVQVLNGEAVTPAADPQLPDFARKRTLTYPAGAGLHARPATTFVDMAGLFKADILVRHNDKTADGKAMSSLLRLGVTGGSTIVLSAEGPDADAALDALCEGVAAGLGDEAHAEEPMAVVDRHYDGELLSGGAGAPGIAVAPLVVWQPGDVQISAVAGTVAEEGAKLDSAVQQAITNLDALIAESEQSKQQDQQGIFQAHRALLRDPDVVSEVRTALASGTSAASAWWTSLSRRAAEQSQVADERLAARAADWRDIGQRVLALLDPSAVGNSAPVLAEPAILVAADLTPSQTATLDKDKVLAIVTAQGGPTSHTAILARALGIPALVGMGSDVLQARSERAIADGDAGILVISPTENDLTRAAATQRAGEVARQVAYEERFQPALMLDAARIEVVGNTGSVSDTSEVLEYGGEGVGLLRSEFLFLGRDTAPTEDEQYQAYKAMVDTLNGFPLIIRTLDIGGDKVVPYLNLPHEDNPFLGVRDIGTMLIPVELITAGNVSSFCAWARCE